MRAQFSLRTLIVVMTLGGPLLAAGVNVAAKLARFLSPDEVHPVHPVSVATWEPALAEAQLVQTIGPGFQTQDERESEIVLTRPGLRRHSSPATE